MHLFLEIMTGPAAGRKLHLKGGQAARVGRTEWADFAIPEDPSLADIHFQIECFGEGCQLRDLDTSGGTLLNGAPIKGTVDVPSGARIKAGKTTFEVNFDESGLAGSVATPATAGEAADHAALMSAAPLDAVSLCTKLKLSEDSAKLAAPGMLAAEFAERLRQSQHYADALRVIAFTLPKPAAVTWGVKMVQSIAGAVRPGEDEAALAVAAAWAAAPSEKLRREAQSAADATKLQTAPGWIAMAAFWSGGSLSAPDLPPVPPAETLTCQGLTGALMLAVAVPPATQMTLRYDSIVRAGLAALQGGAASV